MNGWEEAQALVAAVTLNPAFEKKHPRGRDGRFIEKGGYVKFLDLTANLWRLAKVEDISDHGKIKLSWNQNGKQVEEVKSKRLLFATTAPKATLTPTKWKKVGQQAGSNPGAFFEDANGDKWYVKTPQSAAHVGNENLMNRLYSAAGAPVPQTAVSPDGKRFMSKIEDSVDWHTLSGDNLEHAQEMVAKNFVVDAWLANWDAALNDNMRITKDGLALRVDAGGAGMFRARGGVRDLTYDVGELKTLRDPAVSRDGAKLYSKVTPRDEDNAVRRILAIPPAKIEAMVAEEGLPVTLANKLIARRAWLATNYGYKLPESQPSGQAFLDDLAKADKPEEPAAAPEPQKDVFKIVADTSVPLAPGAPVWIKDKKETQLQNPGVKVPDLIQVESTNVGWDGKNYLWLKSADGKISLSNVPEADVEILRENNASPTAKYSTGELPQLGDRVDSKAGPGIITELFPLYARVMGDDGKSRVSRIASYGRIAQVGQHDTPLINLKSAGSLVNVGKPADTSNPERRFPLIVYSLPHKANVIVISNDPVNKKSVIMLSNGQRATVPDIKLYDNDTVDRDAVAALPTRSPRTPGLPPTDVFGTIVEGRQALRDALDSNKSGTSDEYTDSIPISIVSQAFSDYFDTYSAGKPSDIERAHVIAKIDEHIDSFKSDLAVTGLKKVADELRNFRAPKARAVVDVNTLPPKEFKFNASVAALINPGDRVIKSKYRSQLEFFIIRRDGRMEYAGANKHSTDSDGHVFPQEQHNMNRIHALLGNDLTDVTPAKYDVAAHELGAKEVDVSGSFGAAEVKFTGALTATQIAQAQQDGITSYQMRYTMGNAKKYVTPGGGFSLKPEVGDRMITFSDDKSPLLGISRTDYDDQVSAAEMERNSAYRKIRTPRVLLRRAGTWYDLGYGGADASKAQNGKFNELPVVSQADVDAIASLRSQYWYSYSATPEPEVTLSDGSVVKHSGASLEGVSAFNSQSQTMSALSGKITDFDSSAKTYNTVSAYFNGVTPVHEYLSKKVQNWDKGNPSGAPVPAPGGQSSGSSTASPATAVTDFTETAGFKALKHKMTVGRDEIKFGALDDRIHEIMNAKYGLGPNGLATLADGTEQGDPYMAQFASDFDGDQQTLVAPTPLFNAVKAMTGIPTLHRGVQSASQRDAIKNGAHFTGTGVYGNGTYTAVNAAVTSSYGRNKAQMTAKPSARGIQNDEVYLGQGEDMGDAMTDRHDIWSKHTNLMSQAEINKVIRWDDGWETNSKIPQQVRSAMKQWDTVLKEKHKAGAATSSITLDAYKTAHRKLAAFRTAIAYTAAMSERGVGTKLTFSSDYGYGSMPYTHSYQIKAAPPGGGSVDLTFKRPWVSQGTRHAKGTKIDPETNYHLEVSNLVNAPGNMWERPKSAAKGRYQNSWWIDYSTSMLDASGLGPILANDSAQWNLAKVAGQKLDARIGFISEPGRWALSAGYDYIYVPGQNFYIFTHRAGFIVKA